MAAAMGQALVRGMVLATRRLLLLGLLPPPPARALRIRPRRRRALLLAALAVHAPRHLQVGGPALPAHPHHHLLLLLHQARMVEKSRADAQMAAASINGMLHQLPRSRRRGLVSVTKREPPSPLIGVAPCLCFRQEWPAAPLGRRRHELSTIGSCLHSKSTEGVEVGDGTGMHRRLLFD